ncbi:MAG: T9SS type A sorting domain-containing protein [Bacteroidia bacterium]|jgi:hypothetical protein|nr:T9SS type A sorting domain-containing protein [Bacteroidia bacterium]
MRYSLLTLVLSGITGLCHAQITITQSDMPSSNDTIRYCNAAANITFTPSATGANYTWNFANLTEISQDVYEYKNSFSTPYFFYFINKIGLKTLDTLGVSTISLTDIYTFYTKNSSVFKVEGLGYSYSSIPLANSYIDEDEIYQFPLQYGDHDSSTYYFDYNLSQYTTYIDYAQNGSRVNDVDGWGSISIPNATYPNVLRVKTTITTFDTITVFGFPVVTPRTTIEYKWLSNTEKIPVLEISGTMFGNNYTINSVKYRYHPAPSSVFENGNASGVWFGVYPNPAQNQVSVSLPGSNNYTAEIYDAAGRVVHQQVVNQMENTVHTEMLCEGVYYIRITDNEKNLSGVQRIVIE